MRKTPLKPVISFLLFLCLKILFMETGVAQNTTSIPVNVGVVLDLEYFDVNIALSCINMALSDFYATRGDYKTRLVLAIRDSKKDVVGAAAAGSLSASPLNFLILSSLFSNYESFFYQKVLRKSAF
jgi:ionotropic glutamate receptor